jgi:hypothetical protein
VSLAVVRVRTIELDDNPERVNEDIDGVRPVVAKFETFLVDRIHVVREDHCKLTSESDINLRPHDGCAPLTAITVEGTCPNLCLPHMVRLLWTDPPYGLVAPDGYVRRDKVSVL